MELKWIKIDSTYWIYAYFQDGTVYRQFDPSPAHNEGGEITEQLVKNNWEKVK